MIRSVFGVVLGFLVAFALSRVGDYILVRVLAPSPDATIVAGRALFFYNIGFGLVAGIMGGFVAALVGARLELLHGLALGAVLLLVSLYSLTLDSGQPDWYVTLLGAVAFGSATTGGWIRARMVAPPPAPEQPARRQQRAQKGIE